MLIYRREKVSFVFEDYDKLEFIPGYVRRINIKYDISLGEKLYKARQYSHVHFWNIDVSMQSLDYALRQAFGFLYNVYNFYSSERVSKEFYRRIFEYTSFLLHQPRWYVFYFIYFRKLSDVGNVVINGEELSKAEIDELSNLCKACPLKEYGCTPTHVFHVAVNKKNIPALCEFLQENYKELIYSAGLNLWYFIQKEGIESLTLLVDMFDILDFRSKGYFLVLLPSYFCRTDCSYCYLGEKIKDRTVADWKDVVEYIRKFDVFANVVFHGGEPTQIEPEYYMAILKHLPTAFYSMQTNLLVGNIEKWIPLFKAMDGNLSTSYPDSMRGGNKDLWWRNMRRLKEEGIKPFVIVIFNPEINIESLYKELREYPFRLNPMYLSERVKKVYALPMDINSNYGSALVKLAKLYLEDRDNFNSVHPIGEILAGMLNNSRSKCPFTFSCHKGTYSIDYKGDVYLSCGYDFKKDVLLGNINNGISELKKSEVYRKADRRGLNILKQCGECEFYYVCQGGCPMYSYYYDGNLLNKMIYCEEYKKLYRYLKAVLQSKLYDEEYLRKKCQNTLNIIAGLG